MTAPGRDGRDPVACLVVRVPASVAAALETAAIVAGDSTDDAAARAFRGYAWRVLGCPCGHDRGRPARRRHRIAQAAAGLARLACAAAGRLGPPACACLTAPLPGRRPHRNRRGPARPPRGPDPGDDQRP